MLVGLLGLMVLVGGSASSMGVFILGPLIRGVASIWIGGLFVLLVWLLVAAMSAAPPARAVAAIAVLGLVGAIAANLSMMGSTAPPSSGGVPPVGSIWFGGAYDPDTHAFSRCPGEVIHGCDHFVNKDEMVRLVAHFPRAVRDAVVIHWGGDTTGHFDQVPANGEFFETTLGPFTEPGWTTVIITDLDGADLADAFLTVLDQ
jgi:hypothetical protein